MSREQDLDRNEKATPHKLDEARKKGNTARSTDVTALVVLLVAMMACFAMGTTAVQRLARLLADGLTLPPSLAAQASSAAKFGAQGLERGLLVMAPLLLGVVVVVVVSGLLQSGVVFSTTPLKPDLNRLNPVQGFKKFFSLRLVYEAVKSTLKLAALIGVTLLALKALLLPAMQLVNVSSKGFLFHLTQSAGGLLAKLCAVLAVFMVVDLLFVRWEFMRNLRMSRREIEDEHKNRDGDPRIKNRLREIRLQFLQRSRSVRNVPEAQVVITNPTRIAVALKYEHGVSPAPQVVSKGAGALAKQIRQAAYKAGVPVVHSPRLARALFKEVQQDAYVPEQWYPPIARILVWLRASTDLKAAANGKSAGARA